MAKKPRITMTTEKADIPKSPPALKIVNLPPPIPIETITLLNSLVAATNGGDISGIGVVILRRFGLRPLIRITDSVRTNPTVAIGLATKMGYLIDSNSSCEDD